MSNTGNNPVEDKGAITLYCLVKKKYFRSFYHLEIIL